MLQFQLPFTALLPTFPTCLNGYGSCHWSFLEELDLLHLFALTNLQERVQLVHQWLQPSFFSFFETHTTEPTHSLPLIHRSTNTSDDLPTSSTTSTTPTSMAFTDHQVVLEKQWILTELVYSCLEFAYQQDFELAQIHTLLSLLAWTHHYVSTSNGGFTQDYLYFKTLLFQCSTPQPHLSSLTWTQSKHSHHFFLNTYFRHYALLKYIFHGPLLSFTTPSTPSTPPSTTTTTTTTTTHPTLHLPSLPMNSPSNALTMRSNDSLVTSLPSNPLESSTSSSPFHAPLHPLASTLTNSTSSTTTTTNNNNNTNNNNGGGGEVFHTIEESEAS